MIRPGQRLTSQDAPQLRRGDVLLWVSDRLFTKLYRNCSSIGLLLDPRTMRTVAIRDSCVSEVPGLRRPTVFEWTIEWERTQMSTWLHSRNSGDIILVFGGALRIHNDCEIEVIRAASTY